MKPVPSCLTNGRSGDVIVFLHGIGGNAAYWKPQLSFFGQWFQAVAWNMPGYGTSAALPEMTFPALAESLERLLGTLPAERFHLVGHSMGHGGAGIHGTAGEPYPYTDTFCHQFSIWKT